MSGFVQSASLSCSTGCRSGVEYDFLREPWLRRRALGTAREQTKMLGYECCEGRITAHLTVTDFSHGPSELT